MALPIVSELYWPMLKALWALGGSGTIEELNDWVTSSLKITDEELTVAYQKSGALVVPDRCSWARSYLKIGSEDLCNLLKDLKIGATVKLVEQVEIDESVFARI